MIAATVNFGLILYCLSSFLKYWFKPEILANQEGILKGMNAAITYDAICLLLLFFIFWVAVNMKIGQMMHFFYHGFPPFIFEISFQCLLKRSLRKIYKVGLSEQLREKQINMIARLRQQDDDNSR